MNPDKDDVAYVWDVLQAIRDILSFVDGVDEPKFRQDKRIRYAVERALLILGEATKNISEDYRGQHTGVPWQRFLRIRNIVAHHYEPEWVGRVWRELPILGQAELQVVSLLPPELRQRQEPG